MRRSSAQPVSEENLGSTISVDMPPGAQFNSSRENIIEKDVDSQGCCAATGVWCGKTMSSIFSKKTLFKRVPILTWLPKYSFSNHFVGDLIAGITAGITILPQTMAYTTLAGLDMEVRLFICILVEFITIYFVYSMVSMPVFWVYLSTWFWDPARMFQWDPLRYLPC